MTEVRRQLSEEFGLGTAFVGWIFVYVALSLLSVAVAYEVIVIDNGWAFFFAGLISATLLIGVSFWLMLRGIGCGWSAKRIGIAFFVALILHQALHRLVVVDPEAFVSTLVLFGAGNVLLISMSMWLGQLVGSRVEKSSWVVPLLLVLAVADLWSVHFGPTATLASDIAEAPESSDMAQQMMVWLPSLSAEAMAVTPAFGIGDLIVGAMLLEIARRFGLRMGLSAVALVAGLIGATLFAFVFRQGGVAALPFMGVAFVLANRKNITWDRREIITCLIFLVVMILVLRFLVTPLVHPDGV